MEQQPHRILGESSHQKDPEITEEQPKELLLLNTKHKVVRSACESLGLRCTEDPQDNWTVWWMDDPSKCANDRLKRLKWGQRINHFPAMSEISIKNHLARNLNRMKKFFPEHYGFHPASFVVPKDGVGLLQFARENEGATFIVKAPSSCEGRGIFLLSSSEVVEALSSKEKEKIFPVNGVVQHYLDHPLLLDGHKFDLRLYVLIRSCDPLSVLLFKDGLVRVCTEKYGEPSAENLKNLHMHLSNYTVNKTSEHFEESSKRSLSKFIEWLEHERGKQAGEKMVEDIIALVAKTVIAVQPTLDSLNKSSFPPKASGFELLGFDVMLDSNLKPWIMEVNQSPSLSVDLEVDLEVKTSLLQETMRALGFAPQKEGAVPWWSVYPGKHPEEFKNLFCFPFPEELFSGNFLELGALSNLLSAVRK